MKLSQITVDVAAEEDGEWRDHPHFEGVQILVRSQESTAYQRARRELLNARAMKRTKLGDQVQDAGETERKLFPFLVRGWKGIDDAEYSEETAQLWASRKIIPEGQPNAGHEYYRAYRLFWEGVNVAALDVGAREREEKKETLGK